MRTSRSFADRMSWLGEQAQTQFLDRNLENHEARRLGSSSPFPSFQKLSSYNSLDFDEKHTIRFQVIVWSVGIPDVKTHTVTIMFRVTLFWNSPPPVLSSSSSSNHHHHQHLIPPEGTRSRSNSLSQYEISPLQQETTTTEATTNEDKQQQQEQDNSFWVMDGRRKAIRRQRSMSFGTAASGGIPNTIEDEDTMDVPPISIINAETFETVGQPDVAMLRKKSRLMRFSCMYRAKLLQESMNVAQFPHDSHDLVLKLGILSQRQPGAKWDRRKWKLGLANESDTQGSVRVPFGVLVDHVAVPGFRISDRGLEFELSPMDHGNPSATPRYQPRGKDHQEFCVKTKIRVKRNSAYYDRNIMPLLDILNLVSISILVSLDANNFFQRGLLCLNIAFVEVGLRTSLDARLPTVGYEIKMQKLLNSYFFSILYIVLESAAMKVLVENHDWPLEKTRLVDHLVAFLLLLNQVYLRMIIYKDFSSSDEFSDWR